MTRQELEPRVSRLEDLYQIRNLQGRFIHYQHMGNYERIVNDCFAQKDPYVKCEMADSGVYEGLESVRRFFMHMKTVLDERRGSMMGLMVMTPVIEVNKDGKTAKGMWHAFGPVTLPGTAYPAAPGQLSQQIAMWLNGKYDNEFVKEDGKWKIRSLHFILIFSTPYEQGWFKQPVAYSWSFSKSVLKPDKPTTLFMPYHVDRYNEFLPGPPEPIE